MHHSRSSCCYCVASLLASVSIVLCGLASVVRCQEVSVTVYAIFDSQIAGAMVDVAAHTDALVGNLTFALYETSLLHSYSVLNRSFRYIPSPLPPAVIELGTIAAVPQSQGEMAKLAFTSSYVVAFQFDKNDTANLFLYLANVKWSNLQIFSGTPWWNPVRRLGILGAQTGQPSDITSNAAYSTKVTVALAVVVFLFFLFVTVISTRRRLVRESRGISFNELIELELELLDEVDRKMMEL